MNGIRQIFEKHEFDLDTQDMFSLNFSIKYIDNLPRTGLIIDEEEAQRAAIIQSPYMERAVGYLATGADYYGESLVAPNGTVKGVVKEIILIHRGLRAVNCAHVQIRKAYRASA